MKDIGKPATSNDSLKRNISVVEECRDDYMSVTYDLGIAKSATQIQSMLEPFFNRLFVNMEHFTSCLDTLAM